MTIRGALGSANLKDPNTHNTVASEVCSLAEEARCFAFRYVQRFPETGNRGVNGYAIGIGCIITFCCDLIVASEKAEWRLPQIGLGIIPAYGGSARLARWVGKGLATRLAMGFPLPGEEAYRIGLAQWLTPHDELIAKAEEVAAHIVKLPPLSVRMVKESITHSLDVLNLKDASLADLYRFGMLELTQDTQEAHNAWREKRHRCSKVTKVNRHSRASGNPRFHFHSAGSSPSRMTSATRSIA